MNIIKIAVPFLAALLSLWVVPPFVLAQTADKDADAVKPVPAKRGGLNKPPAKTSSAKKVKSSKSSAAKKAAKPPKPSAPKKAKSAKAATTKKKKSAKPPAKLSAKAKKTAKKPTAGKANASKKTIPAKTAKKAKSGAEKVKPVTAQRPDTARKEIQTLLDRADAAFAKKDLNKILAATAPDFVAITPDGRKITRPAYRAAYAKMLAKLTSVQSRTRIEGITLNGATASVTIAARARMRGVRDGRPLDITSEGDERQVWSKQKGKWRLHQIRALTHTTTANRMAER